MEGCFTMNRACVVVIGCLMAGIINANMMVEDTFNSNHELNNIVFYNNTVYIAGNGWLFVLDETLQHLSDVSTCSSGTSCNNVNQVLLLNRDKNKLILCGTGNQGRCHTRSLDNLSSLDHDGKNDDNTLFISNDTHRPAVALVNSYDGTLTIGVTYSANLESLAVVTAGGLSYKYPLSTRRAESPFEVADHKNLALKLPEVSSDPLHRSPLENFLLYFKAAFQNDNFSYFFTNQKKLVGEEKYISKMIRICQKDARYQSYTDVIMECIKDGKNYNLLQDVTIVEPGVTPGVDSGDRLFVGTFTSADNPEDVSGDSAICVEKLSKLDEKVLKVKQEEIMCTNSAIQTNKRYLQQQWICNISVFNMDLALCNTNIQTFVFIIGQSPHTMTAKYTLPTDNGYITSVAGHIAGSTGTVVIQAGTSRGHLLQMNLESLDKPLHEFERMRVQKGSPIQKIYTKGGNSTDPTFIMTLSKVLRYRQTNCSEFHTCKEMVDRKNPYCGWCAYLGRSTTQEECPRKGANQWMSSLTSCLSIETTPKGQEANRKTGQVRLAVTNQPEQLPGDKYECLFMIGPKILQQGPATTEQRGTLLCETPALAETAHVSLQLWLKTSTGHTVTLGQAAFLYYRCEQFTQCGVCTNTEGARCEWCSELAKCQTSCGNQPVVNQTSQCVHVLNDTQNLRYIPSMITDKVSFDLEGDVLSSMHILCYNPEKNVLANATLDAKKVTCNLTLPISAGERKTRYRVILRYTTHMSAGHYADIDDEFSSFVTVYSCENLARDCSQCKGLNSTRYKCDWCSSGSCNYSNSVCQPTSQCPAPHIISVVPPDAPTLGRTQVTINGTDLGINVSQVESMTLAGVSCSFVQKQEDLAPYGDFQELVPNLLSCKVGETNLSSEGVAGLVEVTINGQQSTGKVIFTYQNPLISDVSPTFGPLAGGTSVTFRGNNLGIGNQNVQVSFEGSPLDNCQVVQRLDEHNVQCRVPSGLKQNFTYLRLSYGTEKYYEFKKPFSLRANPVVENIVPKAAILSGGNKMKVSGTFLTNAHLITIHAFYNGLMTSSTCKPLSDKLVECPAPVAPNSVIEDLHGKLPDQSARRKRNAPCMCMEVGISVQLDGVTYNDTIEYFPDPVFDKFTEDGSVYKYNQSSQELTLTGKYLNLVVDKYDILVTIGAEMCTVSELTETSLTFVMPKDAPKPVSSSGSFPEVNVTIGNLRVNIGYVEYKGNNQTLHIGLGIGAMVLLVIVVGVLVFFKLRQQKRQNQMLEKKYKDREMEIRQVVRQEFHDMHMTMTNVNKNLVEQGFPYHGYQQFASNIMFASDIRQADLSQTGEGLKEMKGTLQDLEELVLNKTFLKTVIITMEKEKKFFHRERATLAGNICAVLIGRMDYVKELLQDLLAELVEEAMANNKHKTLFRTCERITENLLSNWLSLNLYSHFKSSAGSPLYMLYMAMQLTIESGPIDAITYDAKYTLCEEKLLKKWDTTERENADVKIEAKPLMVKVVVDNGDDIYECRVLDCDTITQVKTKCLNQIYQNYPASSLAVNPIDLSLEWHSGYSGSLSLMDEDASSIVEGRWKRLNTLAHYSVKDDSKLALIDPSNTDDASKGNYANLPDLKVSSPLYANKNAVGETSVAGTSHDEENPLLLTTWHLVKRIDEVTEQTDRSVLEDLYLNRLFTAKQSILDYMHKLFNAVMDEHQCPPPTKFLYDLLDELGEKNKVDPDVIHAWKSHSYPIRVWGTLIKQPSKLFDIHVPVYVEDSLDVIAQVFIESFNLTPQKFTKDTSAQKQIFHSEMNQYREKVKEFYSGVSNVVQTPDDLKMYLANVNAQQQSFKKLTYLRKFFNQLKPYTDNILDDLETVDPKLKQKFENVLDKMEEHENNCESERL